MTHHQPGAAQLHHEVERRRRPMHLLPAFAIIPGGQ